MLPYILSDQKSFCHGFHEFTGKSLLHLCSFVAFAADFLAHCTTHKVLMKGCFGYNLAVAMSRKFERRKEDFQCEVCGTMVSGNGYTNHCPRCLWSKHVDIYPGDRASDCHGLMCPIGIDVKKGQYRVIHKCELCGAVKQNRVSDADDADTVINVAGLW
jgi:hypothetical protein